MTANSIGVAGAWPVGTMTFSRLAQQIVEQVAPQEQELLPEVTRAWLAGELGPSKRGRWLGGTIGFGIDPELITLCIYPLLAAAFAPVITASATGSWKLWQRNRKVSRARTRSGRRARNRSARPADQVVPALGIEQATAVRATCLEAALAAGVSAPKARLLADALFGALTRPPGDSGSATPR